MPTRVVQERLQAQAGKGVLEAGSFGLCERCGRAISLARLRAMPAARTCIDCQQKAETR